MHRYIIRIKSLVASEQEYAQFHQEMKKEAFDPAVAVPGMRSISFINAEEYRRKGETLKDINDAVLRAARRVGKRFAFTVMKEK